MPDPMARLRYVVGLTHAEVAAALGRTEVDVRAVQYRALTFLRQRLGAVRAPKAGRRARIRAAPGVRAAHAPVRPLAMTFAADTPRFGPRFGRQAGVSGSTRR